MTNQGHPLEHALIGCLGGVVATLCVYPLDLAKSKVTSHVRKNGEVARKLSSFEAVREILSTGGLSAFYQGMSGRVFQCFVEDFTFFW